MFQGWAALLVGCFGGVVYLGSSKLVIWFKLDDPLDAIAVHAGGGKTYNFYLSKIIYNE